MDILDVISLNHFVLSDKMSKLVSPAIDKFTSVSICWFEP